MITIACGAWVERMFRDSIPDIYSSRLKRQKKAIVIGAIVFGSDQGLVGQFNDVFGSTVSSSGGGSEYYRNPLLYPLMRLVQALEVPELAEQSRGSRDRTLAMIDAVVAGLQKGETFLIYPSGRAQRRGVEVVGAARAVSEILDRVHKPLWYWFGPVVSGEACSAMPKQESRLAGQCLLRWPRLDYREPAVFTPRRRSP